MENRLSDGDLDASEASFSLAISLKPLYRKPIDSITADKSLKLRKYEFDNEGWGIIEQLVSVLQVNTTVCSV